MNTKPHGHQSGNQPGQSAGVRAGEKHDNDPAVNNHALGDMHWNHHTEDRDSAEQQALHQGENPVPLASQPPENQAVKKGERNEKRKILSELDKQTKGISHRQFPPLELGREQSNKEGRSSCNILSLSAVIHALAIGLVLGA